MDGDCAGPSWRAGRAWGGYDLPEPVPYQPTLEPSCQAHRRRANRGRFMPVPPPATTPVVTIPAPGDMAFPQPAVSPSGMKPWFPPGGRTGVFQKVKFTGDYLPRFSDDSLGMTDLELDVVFGLPFLTVETPLLVTPFYAVHFMDGPDSPDVPPRLHDAAITFQNIRPINDRWLAMFDVTVGQYADDASFDSSEAFRITGGGAGVYRSSDQLEMGARRDVRRSHQYDRSYRLPASSTRRTTMPNINLVFPVPKLVVATAVVRRARQPTNAGRTSAANSAAASGRSDAPTAPTTSSTSPIGACSSATSGRSSAASRATSSSATSSAGSSNIRATATRSTWATR